MGILAVSLAVWVCLGTWIVGAAPYASGTDESVQYVAFAAAKNRWATADDYRAYGIEHYYYPPLYYLLLAPFFGDRPEFTEGYPPGPVPDERYLFSQGGKRLVSDTYLATVPPSLWRLYRTAKGVSLVCGLIALLAMAGTVAVLFPGRRRWWLVLGGVAPWVLLPQFLYYQTLVNNDALVNALAALAIFLFALGVASPAGSRGRRALWGVPVAVGLGIMAKPSALALLPLCLAAAALPTVDGGGSWRKRFLAAGRALLLQGALVIASGGWWLVRGALAGDPFGFAAQREAHGWAVLNNIRMPLDPGWWIGLAARMSRTFIGQFAGETVGIPDRIFFGYLAVPGIILLVTVIGLFTRRGDLSEGHPSARRWFILACLGLVALTNSVSAVVYTHRFFSPYGRLFFPALAAWSAFMAWWLDRLHRRLPRLMPALTAVLVLHAGVLFGWTFANRMVEAVEQPPERLVPLAYRLDDGSLKYVGPIWRAEVAQTLSLPPGRLLGFRVQILRTVALPQYGSVIHAQLDIRGADGSRRRIDCLPFPLGENDACKRWTELGFPTPVDLPTVTAAILRIGATSPAIFARIAPAFYLGVSGAEFSATGKAAIGGKQLDSSLCMTAVYDPAGR